MKAKRLISVILCLMLVVVVFAGCGARKTDSGSAKSDSGEKIYIPVISKGFQHQFWQAVKQGAEKAAKDLKVEISFEGPEGESQVAKQIEMLEAALGKNPNAICLAALDSQAVIPLLQQAKEKNIPIIGFDSGVDSNIPVTTCSTDNLAAAAMAADKMAEKIGGKGEIAIICHDQTSLTGVNRRDGFLNRIKEKYPDIKVVDKQYSGDQAKAADIAKTMILAYPNLKGIFGTNEGAATGAIKGVIEAKMDGKLVVIGYDAGKAQKDAVRSGQMAGAITQDPVGIGYKAVEAAVKAIKGEKLERNIDTGFKWYDKSNIDNEEFKPLLYD